MSFGVDLSDLIRIQVPTLLFLIPGALNNPPSDRGWFYIVCTSFKTTTNIKKTEYDIFTKSKKVKKKIKNIYRYKIILL